MEVAQAPAVVVTTTMAEVDVLAMVAIRRQCRQLHRLRQRREKLSRLQIISSILWQTSWSGAVILG